MPPITQEQQTRLEGFTEQRDALVKEISDLARERDSLSKANNEYNTANSLLTTEIEENQRKIIESTRDTAVSLASLESEKQTAQAELDQLNETKSALQAEIETQLQNLANIKEQIKNLPDFIGEVEKRISDVSEQVQSNASAIMQKAESVDYTVRQLEDFTRVFHDKYIAKEVEVSQKLASLEKRETYLNEREEAINVTYDEIVKTMNEQGKQLPDLKSKGLPQ